jgi:hypothetical protein
MHGSPLDMTIDCIIDQVKKIVKEVPERIRMRISGPAVIILSGCASPPGSGVCSFRCGLHGQHCLLTHISYL